MRRTLALGLAVATACSDTPAGSGGFGTGTAAGGTSDGSGTVADSTAGDPSLPADDSGSDEATSSSAKFDVGDGATGPGDDRTGCQKIDFLFVIDDSGSMGAHQAALVASFPGFIAAIAQDVAGTDHQIMVVTSASLESKGLGADYCACGSEACCDAVCETGYYASCGSSCAGAACPPTSEPCRATYGAGKVRAVGEFSVEAPLCPIASGARYVTAGQPALAETFACMATTGTFGTDENNVEVLLAALGPELQGPGGCNEGFLRDDAILVITILSDASITASEQAGGDPQAWYEAIVARKGGNAEAIVVIGMLNDIEDPSSPCYNEGPAPKLFELVEAFGPRGFADTICQDDYSTLFTAAVAGIDAACDAFEPEG